MAAAMLFFMDNIYKMMYHGYVKLYPEYAAIRYEYFREAKI